MLIQFDQITRQFNEHNVVDNVSFKIGKHEIVGLLGHNGAGKTTIMKMLTGFLEPTFGKIYVNDLDIEQNKTKIQSNIGYLPENCPLWPNMSIIDYLCYQASLKGINQNKIESEVLNVIRKTQLTTKATQTIRTLSKGYKQRVGVASAILNNPEIIILDEPTNGLDPAQTLNMRALIRELARTSTVILSTHIMQEVQAVCERVIILRSGKIITDSNLSDLDKTNRLRVITDQDEKIFKELCAKLFDVDKVQLKNVIDDKYEYVLYIDSELAPKISHEILRSGYLLYEISPEKNNLENLFQDNYYPAENLNYEGENVA